jgi:regulator of replication initiation timing
MAGILADYMDRDDLSGITSKQLEETHKAVEELKGQLRIVEARNVKLSARNNKLNEQVGEANTLLTEATKVTRKERTKKAKNASGRGQRVSAEQVIAEYAAPTKEGSKKEENLTEGSDPLNDLLILSGIQEPN